MRSGVQTRPGMQTRPGAVPTRGGLRPGVPRGPGAQTMMRNGTPGMRQVRPGGVPPVRNGVQAMRGGVPPPRLRAGPLPRHPSSRLAGPGMVQPPAPQMQQQPMRYPSTVGPGGMVNGHVPVANGNQGMQGMPVVSQVFSAANMPQVSSSHKITSHFDRSVYYHVYH